MQLYFSASEDLLEYLRASAPSFHNSWCLGVVLNVAGSFAGALGDNFVRLSFVKERRRTLEKTRSLHRRPLWLLGFFLSVIVNPLLTILSLKFAAAGIVLPFGGMHIFWNVLLMGYLLREKLLMADVCGSLCILVGVCLVLSYGPHEVPAYSLASLSSLAVQPTFTLYLLAEATCVVVCLVASADSSLCTSSSFPPSSSASPHFKSHTFSGVDAALRFAHSPHPRQHLQLQQSDSGTPAGVALQIHDTCGCSSSACGFASMSAPPCHSGACSPPATFGAPAADEADDVRRATKAAGPAAVLVEAGRLSALATLQQRVPPWLRRFSVPVLSGMFGGLGNLSAKGLVELLGTRSLQESLWSSEFAACLLATLFFCSLQLLYLNLALLRHEAKLAVPVVNATLIASGSLGGLLLFREYGNMSAVHLAVFGVGIFFVIGGIAVLASAPSGAVAKASQPELFAQRVEELDGTDEERIALGSFCGFPPPRPPDSAL